eukprot:11946080-Karenia_brevis.AAC.1
MSAGNKTCMLGIVELNMTTRKETGNNRLIEIPAPTRVQMEKHIKENITSGSLIFTDSHKSYNWLKDAGYIHRRVNHKKREFSREEQIFGVTINISTNAAEGLFGRVKTFARGKGVKRISRRDYGLLMA